MPIIPNTANDTIENAANLPSKLDGSTDSLITYFKETIILITNSKCSAVTVNMKSLVPVTYKSKLIMYSTRKALDKMLRALTVFLVLAE